jgi:hypothetical protein
MGKLDQNGTLVDHFPSQRFKLIVPALIFLPSFRGLGEKDTTELDSQSGNLCIWKKVFPSLVGNIF